MYRKLYIVLLICNIITAVIVLNLTFDKAKLKNNNKESNKKIESLKKELELKNKELTSTKLNMEAQKSISEDEIKKIAESFFKSYFSFNYLNKNMIYENIKPYTTAYLQEKLTPKGDAELGASDIDYVSSIEDIHLYYNAYEENTKASVLGVMNHLVKVNGVGNPTPIILKINLVYTQEGWKVNELVFNEVFKNIENI